MSIIKPTTGNRTIMVISGFILILLIFLSLQSFKVLPTSLVLTTPIGAAILTAIIGAAILLETFFEGKMPNLQKDTGALINTIFGGALLIYAVIILFVGISAISDIFSGILGTAYAISFVLLGRELFFD